MRCNETERYRTKSCGSKLVSGAVQAAVTIFGVAVLVDRLEGEKMRREIVQGFPVFVCSSATVITLFSVFFSHI